MEIKKYYFDIPLTLNDVAVGILDGVCAVGLLAAAETANRQRNLARPLSLSLASALDAAPLELDSDSALVAYVFARLDLARHKCQHLPALAIDATILTLLPGAGQDEARQLRGHAHPQDRNAGTHRDQICAA